MIYLHVSILYSLVDPCLVLLISPNWQHSKSNLCPWVNGNVQLCYLWHYVFLPCLPAQQQQLNGSIPYQVLDMDESGSLSFQELCTQIKKLVCTLQRAVPLSILKTMSSKYHLCTFIFSMECAFMWAETSCYVAWQDIYPPIHLTDSDFTVITQVQPPPPPPPSIFLVNHICCNLHASEIYFGGGDRTDGYVMAMEIWVLCILRQPSGTCCCAMPSAD